MPAEHQPLVQVAHPALTRPVLAVAGLVLECAVFLLGGPNAYVSTRPVGQVLVLHAAAALMCGLAFPGWLSSGPARSERSCQGLLATALALLFPVLGALAAAVVALLHWGDRWDKEALLSAYRDLVNALLPGEPLPSDPFVAMDERTWRALELAPFLEIIARSTDGNVIASAFEGVMKLDRQAACRLLRRALSNPHSVTRYYASAALGKIEEQLDAELMTAEHALAERPEDAATMKRLADARFAFHEVNGTDDPVVQYHLSECARLYRTCLERADAAVADECRLKLARVLLLTGDAAGARALFEELVAAGARAPSVFQGAIEACYRLHDHPGLVRVAREARARCPDSDLIRRITDHWLTGSDGGAVTTEEGHPRV